ncbi:MAG TPA: hypothetical protein VGF94_14830 [Kofleriaceae bacterium]|jgi:hypothetical protein
MKLACIALVLAIGCKGGPSQDQCKQLLDHMVDLEFKKAGAAASSDALKAEIAKQKSAVTDKVSNEFLDTCSKKMAKARVECALAASDLDEVAKCDDAK